MLLPDVCLARRRYAVEVIGEALLSWGREGYRRVGERLGVPGETVRDWRRRFGSRAELIAAHFLRWARALDGSLDPPVAQGSLVGDALEAIGVCTRVASLVLARRAPWSWVSALTAGGLLAINTNRLGLRLSDRDPGRLVGVRRRSGGDRVDRAQEIGLFRWRIVGEAADASLSARERGVLVRVVGGARASGPGWAVGARVAQHAGSLDPGVS